MKFTKKRIFVLLVAIVIIVCFVVLIMGRYTKDDVLKDSKALNNNGNTVYITNIGKFRLDLSAMYVVLVNEDGDTLFGARTAIEVGQYQGSAKGVISSPNLGKAVVTATPLNGKNTNDLLESYIADDTVKSTQQIDIDGQQATLIILDGDVQKELYYFEQTNIFYVLYFENTDQSDVLQTQKEAVLKGFTLIE